MSNRRLLLILLLSFDTILIFFAVYLGISFNNPLRFFGEGQFVTWVSTFKLFAMAVLSFMILFNSCQEQKRFCWKPSYVIWLFIALGFIFLAADELFELHEKTDFMIHRLLQMHETRLSDRIDDLIIGIYLMAGVAFLYGFRHELKRYVKFFPLIFTGFIFSIIMVLLDTYTNLDTGDWISPTIYRLSVAEDGLKIYAESFFIMAFYEAVEKSRN